MKIRLIAVGTRMPDWVVTAYNDFAKRLPAESALELIEIPVSQRPKKPSVANLEQAKKEEGEKILARIPDNSLVIALDEQGKPWRTQDLAKQFDDWKQSGGDVALLVGGPDGLSTEVKQRAEHLWSLSPLTLPHALVRPLLAEALYRAWSVTQNHPYHRA